MEDFIVSALLIFEFLIILLWPIFASIKAMKMYVARRRAKARG